MSRPPAPVALLVAASLLLAACSGDDAGRAGAPATTSPPASLLPAEDASTPTIPLPPGFIAPDTRTVTLQPVVGKRKKGEKEPDPNVPTLPMDGGELKLTGTVIGPEGPVEGARVRVERYAGTEFGQRDVTTNKDGRYEVPELPGGRLRVRAWKESLATTESQLAFAPATGELNLDVAVEPHDATAISAALQVAEPHVSEGVDLRAVLYQEQVNPDTGLIEGTGIPNAQLQLGVESGFRIESDNPQTTDPDGTVTWRLVCTVVGVHNVVVSGSGLEIPVQLPECTPGDPGAIDRGPVVPDFPVGSSFAVPRDDPVPAGTYTATTPGSCAVSFEQLTNGQWARQVGFDRTLTLAAPARRFTAVPGAASCTYRRTA